MAPDSLKGNAQDTSSSTLSTMANNPLLVGIYLLPTAKINHPSVVDILQTQSCYFAALSDIYPAPGGPGSQDSLHPNDKSQTSRLLVNMELQLVSRLTTTSSFPISRLQNAFPFVTSPTTSKKEERLTEQRTVFPHACPHYLPSLDQPPYEPHLSKPPFTLGLVEAWLQELSSTTQLPPETSPDVPSDIYVYHTPTESELDSSITMAPTRSSQATKVSDLEVALKTENILTFPQGSPLEEQEHQHLNQDVKTILETRPCYPADAINDEDAKVALDMLHNNPASFSLGETIFINTIHVRFSEEDTLWKNCVNKPPTLQSPKYNSQCPLQEKVVKYNRYHFGIQDLPAQRVTWNKCWEEMFTNAAIKNLRISSKDRPERFWGFHEKAFNDVEKKKIRSLPQPTMLKIVEQIYAVSLIWHDCSSPDGGITKKYMSYASRDGAILVATLRKFFSQVREKVAEQASASEQAPAPAAKEPGRDTFVFSVLGTAEIGFTVYIHWAEVDSSVTPPTVTYRMSEVHQARLRSSTDLNNLRSIFLSIIKWMRETRLKKIKDELARLE